MRSCLHSASPRPNLGSWRPEMMVMILIVVVICHEWRQSRNECSWRSSSSMICSAVSHPHPPATVWAPDHHPSHHEEMLITIHSEKLMENCFTIINLCCSSMGFSFCSLSPESFHVQDRSSHERMTVSSAHSKTTSQELLLLIILLYYS